MNRNEQYTEGISFLEEVTQKLKNRIDGHKANMSDDYQTLKAIVEEKKKTDILNEWLAKKQSETYIRIKEGWRNCEFKYDGWIKK